MSRDHRKLRAFQEADALVLEIYPASANLPATERYGLQAQIRRAALSVPTNLVEGAARPTTADYCHFVAIACGSARECEYLLSVASRLGFLGEALAEPLIGRYNRLAGSLLALRRALRPSSRREP